MASRCLHYGPHLEGRSTGLGCGWVEADICCRCGAWLSLGPANDTPEALVELRAAELSDIATSHATSTEAHGWSLKDGEPSDEFLAGYLGRVIYEHNHQGPHAPTWPVITEEDERAALHHARAIHEHEEG